MMCYLYVLLCSIACIIFTALFKSGLFHMQHHTILIQASEFLCLFVILRNSAAISCVYMQHHIKITIV